MYGFSEKACLLCEPRLQYPEFPPIPPCSHENQTFATPFRPCCKSYLSNSIESSLVSSPCMASHFHSPAIPLALLHPATENFCSLVNACIGARRSQNQPSLRLEPMPLFRFRLVHTNKAGVYLWTPSLSYRKRNRNSRSGPKLRHRKRGASSYLHGDLRLAGVLQGMCRCQLTKGRRVGRHWCQGFYQMRRERRHCLRKRGISLRGRTSRRLLLPTLITHPSARIGEEEKKT